MPFLRATRLTLTLIAGLLWVMPGASEESPVPCAQPYASDSFAVSSMGMVLGEEDPQPPSPEDPGKLNKAAIIGKTAGEIVGFDQNNAPIKLSNYKGKVILLNLAASWCIGCKDQAAEFQRYAESVAEKGVACITCLGVRDSQLSTWMWAKKYNIKTPVMIEDQVQKWTKFYLSNIFIYSTFVVIDQEFTVRESVVSDLNKAIEVVESLL